MIRSAQPTLRWSTILLAALLWIGLQTAPRLVTASSGLNKPTLEELAKAAKVVPLPLRPCELKLLQKAPKGDVAYCGPEGKKLSDQVNDPESGDPWGSEREIRADLIVWLFVDHEASKLVDPLGVQVEAARISGEINLSFVVSTFQLMLSRCRLDGALTLTGAKLERLNLEGSRTQAIWADDVMVGDSIFLKNRFHAVGEVDLINATIGSNLECDGSHFDNPKGIALNADGVRVRGYVFLRDDFQATGGVKLLNATIGSNLECRRGSFIDPNPPPQVAALDGANLKTGGSVSLNNGFRAEGSVWLSVAEIGRDLDLTRGDFSRTSLSLEATTVKGTLFYKNIATGGAPSWLGLAGTSVGQLYDNLDSLSDWPAKGNLDLDGFAYSYLQNPSTATRRLEWLRLQLPANETERRGRFRPQPYEQLAKVLRDKGLDSYARQVLIGMENDRRRYADLTWYGWLWAWSLRLTVGYGYRPLQVVPWLAVFWMGGVLLFGAGYRAKLIAPTEEDAYERFTDSGTVPPYYEPFSAPVYALDVLLPIIELGQRKCWAPALPAHSSKRHRRMYVITWLYRLINILVGWFIATMLAVGIGGLVAK